MHLELIYGLKLVIHVQESLPTWMFLSWKDGMSREQLLELCIRQLERLPKDQQMAFEKLKAARLSNKDRFDKIHQLRTKKIQEGDWMLVFDSTLEHQYSTVQKFAKRWLGSYVVVKVHDNATYFLRN